MLGKPIVYILLIALLSIGVAYFQYYFKARRISVKTHLFAFLRFLSLFLLGLLLLNPKFKQTEFSNIKPKLVVAIDASESVRFFEQDTQVRNFINQLKLSELSSQFDIDYYRFGKNTEGISDAISFTDKQTNIAQVFTDFKDLYTNNIAPTIIVTDGNQTFGHDYVVASKTYQQPIYPVVIGDTVLKNDLKIAQLHHNKYAFLKNKFPLDITLRYQGKDTINQYFTISKDNTVVYRKSLSFSPKNNTQVLSLSLPAIGTGKQKYTAKIATLESEENINNNSRDFSIQVIDERTTVLLVSPILHPDIGALKKAIESNKQRKVVIVKSISSLNLNDYQLVIVYQPDASCKALFEQIKQFNKNYWLIGGLQTNWPLVNSAQTNFKFYPTNQTQDYQASFNSSFGLFQQENLSFSTFPPLQANYGRLELNNNVHTLLYQDINEIVTENALDAFFENNGQRTVLLLGEGIWKWRAQSYLQESTFEPFDAFVGNTVQYLSSNTKKERLVVNTEESFNIGYAEMEAQYFDKNYVFDSSAKITANIHNTNTDKRYTFDFLFKGNAYQLDLSTLPPGNYEYRVAVTQEGLLKKGTFEILDFNIEAQFLNPAVTKLQQIATNSKSKYYHINDKEALFRDLAVNENYKTLQKTTYKDSPLIAWKYLLVLLLLVLSLEWFLRKYNGLI